MCAPSGDENTADGGFTFPAWLAGAQIDAVFELKEAPHPIGVYVVGNRGASEADGVAKNLAQGKS